MSLLLKYFTRKFEIEVLYLFACDLHIVNFLFRFFEWISLQSCNAPLAFYFFQLVNRRKQHNVSLERASRWSISVPPFMIRSHFFKDRVLGANSNIFFVVLLSWPFPAFSSSGDYAVSLEEVWWARSKFSFRPIVDRSDSRKLSSQRIHCCCNVSIAQITCNFFYKAAAYLPLSIKVLCNQWSCRLCFKLQSRIYCAIFKTITLFLFQTNPFLLFKISMSLIFWVIRRH